MHAAIPVVEIADHAGALRIRRPDRKIDAAHAANRPELRAELLIDLEVIALGEKVQVDLAHERAVAIRILHDLLGTIVSDRAHLVVAVASRSRQHRLEKAFGMQTIGGDFLPSARRSDAHLLCVWAKHPDDEIIAHAVRTQNPERIRVRAREKRVHFVDRQAEDFEGCHAKRPSLPRTSELKTLDAHRSPPRHPATLRRFLVSLGATALDSPHGMDQTFNTVVEDLLRTYRENGGINYIEAAATLPSRPAVDAACVELLSILFPGFHGEPLVHAGELPEATMTRIKALHRRLKPEICKSLMAVKPSASVETDAEEILRFFFSQLARLREMLWADIDAAYEGDPAAISYEEIILAYPTIEAIAIQRMAHLPLPKGPPAHPPNDDGVGARPNRHRYPSRRADRVALLHRSRHRRRRRRDLCDRLAREALSRRTLGARSFQKDDQGHIRKGGKRHPNVEDHVTIYPNSTVLGGETVVGARSTIGGNVFLTESVPPDSLVYYQGKQIATVSKRDRHPDVARHF
jgi:serine O-acetyltransferase